MNTFGRLFRVTTFGESHGKAVGAVIDGCPPGIPLAEEDVARELRRRRPGQSDVVTPRHEADEPEILSGVFEGVTTGTPIAVIVWNKEQRSEDYDQLKDVYRPGHADFTYEKKYGVRDWRGSGRASGRETLGRTAGGAVAKKVLATFGITVQAATVRVGDVVGRAWDAAQIERNPVRAADPRAVAAMVAAIEKARAEKDSLGGIVEVRVLGAPAGLGDPAFAKLGASLGGALMSIGAVKGVEIGEGFALAGMRGSESNDPLAPEGFTRNRAGGILGGISTGSPIVARMAVKPTSSIGITQRTIDRAGVPREISIGGRHDPCICPRIVPVAEAMAALVVVDAVLSQRALRPEALAHTDSPSGGSL